MYALLCNKTLYIYIYINKSNAPQVLFACLGLVGTVLSGVTKGITTVSPPSPGHAYKFLYLTEVGTRLEVVGIGGNVSKMVIG